MRIMGRIFKHKGCTFKAIESGTGFVKYPVGRDPVWCRLLKGKLKGFDIGDEVTIRRSEIEEALK